MLVIGIEICIKKNQDSPRYSYKNILFTQNCPIYSLLYCRLDAGIFRGMRRVGPATFRCGCSDLYSLSRPLPLLFLLPSFCIACLVANFPGLNK